MKALPGAAMLLVAMAETSTDWSSNMNPSLFLPAGGGGATASLRGGLDPCLLGARWGPRSQAEVLCQAGFEGGCGGRSHPEGRSFRMQERWRGSFWDNGPQPEGYTEAQMQR